MTRKVVVEIRGNLEYPFLISTELLDEFEESIRSGLVEDKYNKYAITGVYAKNYSYYFVDKEFVIMKRIDIVEDGDGHTYLVPIEDIDRFHRWVESDDYENGEFNNLEVDPSSIKYYLIDENMVGVVKR